MGKVPAEALPMATPISTSVMAPPEVLGTARAELNEHAIADTTCASRNAVGGGRRPALQNAIQSTPLASSPPKGAEATPFRGGISRCNRYCRGLSREILLA